MRGGGGGGSARDYLRGRELPPLPMSRNGSRMDSMFSRRSPPRGMRGFG